VPLVYQLSARLGSDGPEEFRVTLRQVLERVCAEYPHHTMPHLYALCNANAAKNVGDDPVSPKAKMAREVLGSVERVNRKLEHISIGLKYLSQALYTLAYHPPVRDEKLLSVPGVCCGLWASR
jgi:hypothetical protein